MSEGYEQGCPVAVALDVIGDRWTLLLLRDLTHAPMRFTDFQAINPKISPNLLTKRLRSLQDSGIVVRRQLPPPAATTVYELEPRSREALLPVLNALGRFGAFLFENAPTGPSEALLRQMRLNRHWVLAKGVDFEACYRFVLGDHDIGLTVGPATFEPSATPPQAPDATIVSDSVTLTRLFNAGHTLTAAEAAGELKITGDRAAALALLEKFSLAPLAA
ncbi:winged helix-turn-helix transcriptional regulator [Actinomadura rudentiformis]|uniref:winged helix-turn-helix transcriptional regulator n=1 Tax=Actinomadura rudentiformis TaxID=359158 RepID=UPI00178C68D7|nr:winged helix-turn-helix transcriptional regulator [Actinomadura rudentiformis]